MARFAVGLSLALLLSILAFSQSDPQALAFAAQSMSAMTGGATISDITFNGNATRTVGSDVGTGPATFYGKGQYESRLNLALSNGTRTEIRNSTNSAQGEWLDSNNNAYPFAQFNCLTDAVWFYPPLSSLSSASNSNTYQVLSYIGLETLNGESVQHIQSVWFGLASGGVLCDACRIGQPHVAAVSAGDLEAIRALASPGQAWRELDPSPAGLAPVRETVGAVISHVLGHRPRLRPLLGV